MFAWMIAAILYLSLLYVFGRATARFAAQRGRSEVPWFVLGCLFFPIPSIVLALLPRREDPRGPRPQDGRRSAGTRPQIKQPDAHPRIAVLANACC
jgi:hypothetical protein